MTKEQALALLKLIADLYQIVGAPDPKPEALDPTKDKKLEP